MKTRKPLNKFLIICGVAFAAVFGKVYAADLWSLSRTFVSVVHAQSSEPKSELEPKTETQFSDETETPETQSSTEPTPTTIEIEVFWSIGCPHCAEERRFLSKLEKWDENVAIKEYEISRNNENLRLFQSYDEKLNANVSGVPFTVINEKKYVPGFDKAETTGLQIINELQKIRGADIFSTYKEAENFYTKAPAESPQQNQENNAITQEKFSFLFFKDINLKTASLPLLTFVLALADGFNPCAMWVLLFLISLLIGMEDKKRRWIIGGTFILASGLVYFLFLTAWLKFFQFLGYVSWVRYIIGGVALTAAFIYIKDVIKDPGGCKVVGGNENRKKVFSKLREYALRDNLLVALAGITLLAFGVNLVEFFCSAGLPATFADILAMNNLNPFAYYAYMVFYVVIFMIDDFVVFAIAMITLKATGIESKYARCAHLVGGILMLFIGLALILRPDLLMFG
ncbi:hypothetical protein GF360_00155 [candidate division WWE3 bacterium]|nr:hypothetical protein [candidate division WWE3 bacterium]